MHLASSALHLRRKLVDVPKDGNTGICKAGPARHLDDHGAAGVGQDVARVDGQWAQAEDGLACAVARKVHECAERVARASVVHGAHHCAQVRVCRLLHLSHAQHNHDQHGPKPKPCRCIMSLKQGPGQGKL